MKSRRPFVAILAGLGLILAASAQEEIKFNAPGSTTPKATQPAQAAPKAATPAAAAPAATAAAAPAAAPKYTEAQIMEAYGWLMGTRMGLAQLEFTPANVEAMARGMALAAQGRMLGFDTQAVGQEIEAMLSNRNSIFMGKLKQQGMADTAGYLMKLKENKAVSELPSGLRYEVLKQGSGAFPKAGQMAKVHYSGSFINGQVFDSSVQRGQPEELILQEPSAADPRGVIPGIAEGLQKINPGGKIRLHIPPHLAYGDNGVPGGIPPAATLVFEFELLEVKDAPKYVPPPEQPAGAK